MVPKSDRLVAVAASTPLADSVSDPVPVAQDDSSRAALIAAVPAISTRRIRRGEIDDMRVCSSRCSRALG